MSLTTDYSPKESSGHAAAVQVRRSVNDEIVQTAHRFQLDDGRLLEFLCECGDLSCDRRVESTVADYRSFVPGSVVAH